MAQSSVTLEFHSGVVRFDASFNLFVVVPHSKDDPLPLVLDGADSGRVPGGDRRGRVVGRHGEGEGLISGVFPLTGDLPRGLVMDIRGFDSAELRDDGALVVTCSYPSELPDWIGEAGVVLFRREGERLRLWSKSSVRDSFSTDESAKPTAPAEPKKKAATKKAAAKKPAATEKAAAKKKPAATEKGAPTTPEAEAAPSPPPAAESKPSSAPRPTPAAPPPRESQSAANTRKGSRLGCSTLALLVGLTVIALALLA
jgi:hypothetical protein